MLDDFTRALGGNVNEFGRTGPHPDAPRLRDPLAPKQKPAPLSLTLDAVSRSAVARGALTARLDPSAPKWAAGDRVTITREWRKVVQSDGTTLERQDPPLAILVSGVDRIAVGDITKAQVVALGLRTVPDFARGWLDLDEHVHALSLQARLKRERTTVWLTSFKVRLPHEVRVLGPTTGYVTSVTSPQMRSAGEAVPEDYQLELSAASSRTWSAKRATRLAERLAAREAGKQLRRSLSVSAGKPGKPGPVSVEFGPREQA